MFGRTITAIITPMKENGEIDWNGFKKTLDYQLDGEVHDIVVLGTTGESPTIEPAERRKLIRMAIRNFKIYRESKVIVGTGTNNTKKSIELTKQARDLGADAALVVTPYYNKPNTSGLIEHYKVISDIMPTIVYDIKGRTGRQITLEEFQKICANPNVIGIKAASGDMEQITDVIKNVAQPIKHRREFYLWSGDDKLTLPVMRAGGHGVISVISNLTPETVNAMVNAESDGSKTVADDIAKSMEELIKAAFIENNPVGIKRMMHLEGIIESDAVRLPLGKISDKNDEFIRNAIINFGKYRIR